MYSILYVDDEPTLLEIGKIFLEEKGLFSVDTVLSAQKALLKISEKKYDAIISDFQMPVMDGIEFLKRVRASGNTVPFIIFTGRGREEIVIQAINEGADFYLQKGGDPTAQFAELAHKIRQAIARRQAETSIRDHERREADIINFLPDATLAIDTHGVVIAWNRAMEMMTGVKSSEILGKGNYEYAIPFYHERRPILIDLVLKDDPITAGKYPAITRDGTTLFSEITIPHFNDGRGAVLWFTATPLYNRKGDVIGAIESIREITERKRAEEALNESEKRFRDLADLLPQGIFEADIDGRMTYVNRIALEMSGYTAEDVERGINALNVIAVEDRERAAMIFRQMVERGIRKQGSQEFQAVRKDGSTFPVSIFSSPIPHDDRIDGIRGIIIDITDRKHAEEKIRDSEQNYRLLFETATEGILIAQGDRMVHVNPAMIGLLGYPADIITSRPFTDFIHPDDRENVLSRHLQRMRGEIPLTGYEFRIIDGQGHEKWVWINSTRISWSGKSASLSFLTDVTERKKAADSLVAANREYTNLLGQIQDVYYRCDTEGRLVKASNSWATLFGYDDVSDCLGRSIADDFYMNPADRKPLLEEITRNGKVTDYEVLLKKKDGTPLIVEARSHLYYDPSGNVIGIEGTFRDITDRKRAEEELRAAYEQLTASQEELKGQFDELAASERRVRESESRLKYMLGFYEMSQQPEKELLSYAVEGSGIVTGSPLGYLAFLNEEETELAMYAWSRAAMQECFMREKPIIYQMGKTGLWGEAVRQRRPVITNDYQSPNLMKRGYPEGHPAIIRHMNIPVLDGDHIVIVAGVANKPSDYSDNDVKELTLLMQGLWQVIKRRRAEEELRAAHEQITASQEELKGQFDELEVREKRIRESESRFRQLAEATMEGIVFHKSGIILDLNERACELFGYPRNEMIGRNVLTLTAPECIEFVQQKIIQGYDKSYEAKGLRKDGSSFWAELQSHEFTSGSESFRITTLWDITERKKSDEALKESEEKYRTLVEVNHDIIYSLDIDGSVLYVSPQITEQLGYRQDEIQGRDFMQLVHPDDVENLLLHIKEHFDAGKAVLPDTFRIRRKDGAYRWFEDRTIYTKDPQGRHIIIGTIRDITENTRTRKALQESETKYRHIIENLQDVYFQTDLDGNLSMVSPSAALIYGYSSADEMIGIPAESLYYNPGQREEILHILQRQGKLVDFTGEARRKDGTPFWASLNIQFRFDEEGRIKGTEAIVRDISERKNMEEAIREINRKVSLLTSITRHDVANQVSILRGYAKIAMMKKPDPVVVDLLEKIDATGSVISGQIAFTKAYQELGMHAPGWHRIREIIEQQKSEGISLSCTCDAVVFADPMLEKVFFNLIDNAARHGDRVTTIAVSCKPDPDGLVITVEDNGVGVPLDLKEKIFEKDYGKHTGFGLFLAREILSITGITIHETGLQGKGARFEIIVPKGKYRGGKQNT